MIKKKSTTPVTHIIKDQLMTEESFIRFCNGDYIGNGDRRMHITSEFISAAQKDGFLLPLVTEVVEATNDQGAKIERSINYYSPHQLFVVVGLRKNVIKDDRLSSEEQMVWGVQNCRTLLWGPSYGITVNNDTGQPIGKTLSVDVHGSAKNYDKFLRLLHSQPQLDDYQARDRGRSFTMAPRVTFDLSAFRSKGLEILEEYDLTTADLVGLRHHIGALATKIDPLEYWHDYLEKHPTWRKDTFKGDALIAHELYLTDGLISEILEATTEEGQPTLMELLHQGSQFKPYLLPEIDYANGIDVKALETCFAKAHKWLQTPENAALAPDGSIARLNAVETELQEYKDLYGDRSYLSGVPRPVDMDDIALDKLDPVTRKFAEDMIKDMDPDDADYQIEYQMEVGQAISSRLTFLRHDIWEAIDALGANLRQKKEAAWREYEDSRAWGSHEIDQETLWQNTKDLDGQVDEFRDILSDFSLVYCQECRERPVALHHSHYDQQASNDPICDDCFKKVADGELDMAPGSWPKSGGGEWRCDYCIDPRSGERPLLSKFAQRNVIRLQSLTQVPIKIELKYGKVVLEAKCKKCGTLQRRSIDWGWVS